MLFKKKSEACAWCLTKTGELASQGQNDSHGICEEHSDQVWEEYELRKFNRIPSYFERFSRKDKGKK